MARVPTAQNLVSRQPVTDAKFRTFDAGSEAIGEGLQRLGRSMDRFADGQAKVQEIRAEEEARRLDTEHMGLVRPVRESVRSAQGINARTVAAEGEAQLKTINQELLARASTPLARKLLEASIAKRTEQEIGAFSTHALGEETKAIEAGYESRADGFGETALDHAEDETAFNENLSAGVAEIEARGRWAGWTSDQTERQKSAFRSKVLVGKARQRFMADDPQGALAVLDANRDFIDASDEATMRAAIKPSLDDLQADSDVALVMSGSPAVPDVPPGETTFQSPIRAQTVTVAGGQYGAPRSYGAHAGLDQAGVKPGTPVYPIAEGTVAKVTKTKGGGNTVELALAGGWKVRYLHLADGSTASLEEGQRVGVNDIVGGVGNTGTASRGVHLHTEVYDPSGKRVDPSKLYGQPAPRTAAPDGSRVDLARGYAEIDKQPWSAARKSRARERLRSYASENDTVKAREEADAGRAITETLIALEKKGLKPTALSQFDPQVLAKANPSTVLQLTEAINANNAPKPVEANGDGVLNLELMSVYEPDKFKNTDLRLYRHTMTDAEFATLAKTQAEMRTKGPDAPVAIDHGNIWTVINRYGPDVGLNPTSKSSEQRQRTFRVFDMVRKDLERVTEGKRKPTDDEIKGAFDRATMNVVLPGGGFFGGDKTVRRFDNTEGAPVRISIPVDVRDRIIRAYRMAEGRVPNETEIGTMYLRNRGRRGYWQ